MSTNPTTEARAALVATLRSAQSPWMHQAANEIEALVEDLATVTRERDDYRSVAERVDVMLDAAGVGCADGPESSQLERSVAALIRERDEARARIATIDKDVGRLQDVVRVALCDAVKGTIPTANLSRIDGGCSDGDEFEFTATEVSIACGMLTEEIDELRAALLNERGLGSGPSEGWAYRRGDFDETGEWFRPGAKVWIYEGEWSWGVGRHGAYTGDANQPPGQTAREAMIAADAALAGGKS